MAKPEKESSTRITHTRNIFFLHIRTPPFNSLLVHYITAGNNTSSVSTDIISPSQNMLKYFSKQLGLLILHGKTGSLGHYRDICYSFGPCNGRLRCVPGHRKLHFTPFLVACLKDGFCMRKPSGPFACSRMVYGQKIPDHDQKSGSLDSLYHPPRHRDKNDTRKQRGNKVLYRGSYKRQDPAFSCHCHLHRCPCSGGKPGYPGKSCYLPFCFNRNNYCYPVDFGRAHGKQVRCYTREKNGNGRRSTSLSDRFKNTDNPSFLKGQNKKCE